MTLITLTKHGEVKSLIKEVLRTNGESTWGTICAKAKDFAVDRALLIDTAKQLVDAGEVNKRTEALESGGKVTFLSMPDATPTSQAGGFTRMGALTGNMASLERVNRILRRRGESAIDPVARQQQECQGILRSIPMGCREEYYEKARTDSHPRRPPLYLANEAVRLYKRMQRDMEIEREEMELRGETGNGSIERSEHTYEEA